MGAAVMTQGLRKSKSESQIPNVQGQAREYIQKLNSDFKQIGDKILEN